MTLSDPLSRRYYIFISMAMNGGACGKAEIPLTAAQEPGG